MTTQRDLPSRRSRRAVQVRRRPRHRRVVSQLSVLGALALATVALPLSGFVTPHSAMLATPQLPAVAASASWADMHQRVTDAQGTPLKDEPAAVTRARLNEAIGTCAAAGEAGQLQSLRDNDDIVYFPLQKGVFRVSSPFGYRIHPITHRLALHTGADFAAPAGTPIHAASSGVVQFAGPMGTGGNVVRIHHHSATQDYYTQYDHILPGGTRVSVGEQVKAGQVIAVVGSTGRSTGPHLHFEVQPTLNQPVDPVPWLKEHHSFYIGDDGCQ